LHDYESFILILMLLMKVYSTSIYECEILKQLQRFVFKIAEKKQTSPNDAEEYATQHWGAGFQRGRVFGDRGRGLIQSGGS